MAKPQDQNEEQAKKYKSYQDLVMQQDPLLQEENDPSVSKSNDQSGKDKEQAERQYGEAVREELTSEGQKEAQVSQATQDTVTKIDQEQQKAFVNTLINQSQAQAQAQTIADKKLAVGKLKVIEGIAKMAADRIEDLKGEQLTQQAQQTEDQLLQQETQTLAQEADGQMQAQAVQELQRQQQIQQMQQQRQKEAQEKQQLQAKKKKRAQQTSFLGLVKKQANPTSPSKTLNRGVPGLGLISKYFEWIVP